MGSFIQSGEKAPDWKAQVFHSAIFENLNKFSINWPFNQSWKSRWSEFLINLFSNVQANESEYKLLIEDFKRSKWFEAYQKDLIRPDSKLSERCDALELLLPLGIGFDQAPEVLLKLAKIENFKFSSPIELYAQKASKEDVEVIIPKVIGENVPYSNIRGYYIISFLLDHLKRWHDAGSLKMICEEIKKTNSNSRDYQLFIKDLTKIKKEAAKNGNSLSLETIAVSMPLI